MPAIRRRRGRACGRWRRQSSAFAIGVHPQAVPDLSAEARRRSSRSTAHRRRRVRARRRDVDARRAGADVPPADRDRARGASCRSSSTCCARTTSRRGCCARRRRVGGVMHSVLGRRRARARTPRLGSRSRSRARSRQPNARRPSKPRARYRRALLAETDAPDQAPAAGAARAPSRRSSRRHRRARGRSRRRSPGDRRAHRRQRAANLSSVVTLRARRQPHLPATLMSHRSPAKPAGIVAPSGGTVRALRPEHHGRSTRFAHARPAHFVHRQRRSTTSDPDDGVNDSTRSDRGASAAPSLGMTGMAKDNPLEIKNQQLKASCEETSRPSRRPWSGGGKGCRTRTRQRELEVALRDQAG